MTTKIVTNIDTSNDIAAIGFSGFKNRLINPLYQVDIEGNAGGVGASASHVVEGWRSVNNNGVSVITLSRVTGDSVPYALRYAVTTGSDTSIAVGDYAAIQTAIEGYDISDAEWGTVAAKSVWISGRVKAPTTATYCVAVRNSAGNRSYVFEVACTANTFVDFEKEIIGDTSGTWETTNSAGLLLDFAIAVGSTFHTTADSWSAGNYFATANQANGLATNGNIYEIEDIRVSVGKPIQTEWRPYPLDLEYCQRYFLKITEVGLIAVATGASNDFEIRIPFPTTMRTSPTISSLGGFTTSNVALGGFNRGSVNSFGYLIRSTAAGQMSSVGGIVTASARMI